jgi:hypothetical protein
MARARYATLREAHHKLLPLIFNLHLQTSNSNHHAGKESA